MNKKYLSIGISIITLLLIALIIFNFIKKEPSVTYQFITASDGSCKIELPNTISYQMNTQENNDFIIDLYSKQDEMFLYLSRIEKNRIVHLEDIVKADKENYMKNKENNQDISNIEKIDFKDNTAYEYHFIHYDASYGKDFYSYVLWIETEKNLYVLNFEVITQNLEKYQDVLLNIKNSFVEL